MNVAVGLAYASLMMQVSVGVDRFGMVKKWLHQVLVFQLSLIRNRIPAKSIQIQS
jgi:hypothetical protein